MRGLRLLALVVLLSACARARSLSDLHPENTTEFHKGHHTEGHPANLHEGQHAGHHSESHHSADHDHHHPVDRHSEEHHSAALQPVDQHSEEHHSAAHHSVDHHSEVHHHVNHHSVKHHSVEHHSLEHHPVHGKHHSLDHHPSYQWEDYSEYLLKHKHNHSVDSHPSGDNSLNAEHQSKDPKHAVSQGHSIVELTSEPEYKEESHFADLNVFSEGLNAEDPKLSKDINVQSEDLNPVVVNLPEGLEKSGNNLNSQDENSSVQDHLPELVSLIKNLTISEDQNIGSGEFNFNANDIQVLLNSESSSEDNQSSEEVNGLLNRSGSENMHKPLSNYKIHPRFVKNLSKILRPFFQNSDENSFDLTKERIINKVTNNDNSVEILPLNPIRVNKDNKAPLALILGAPKGDKGRRKYFYSKKHKNGHVKANVEILDTDSDEKTSETGRDNYKIDDGVNANANLNNVVINFENGIVEPNENVVNSNDEEEKDGDYKQDAVVAVLDFALENDETNSEVVEENNSVYGDEQAKDGQLRVQDYVKVADNENQDIINLIDKENSSDLSDDYYSNDYDNAESSQSENDSNDTELEENRAEHNSDTSLGDVEEKNDSDTTENDESNSLENLERSAELNDYLLDLGSESKDEIASGENTKENDEEYVDKSMKVVRVQGNDVEDEVGDGEVYETSNESIAKVSSEETDNVDPNVHDSTELELKIEKGDKTKKYVLKFEGDKKNNFKVGCSEDLKKLLEDRQGTHKSYNLSFLFHR